MADRPSDEADRAAIRQERRRIANAQSGGPLGSPSRNARRADTSVSPTANTRQSSDGAIGTGGNSGLQRADSLRPGDLVSPKRALNSQLPVLSPRDSRSARRRFPNSPRREATSPSPQGRSDAVALSRDNSEGGTSVGSGVGRRAFKSDKLLRKSRSHGALSRDESGSVRSARTDRRSQSGGGSVASKEAQEVGRAEMHIIGEIVGGSRFQQSALFCRWQLIYDPVKSWVVKRGQEQGGTQVSSVDTVADNDFVAWEHPLDIHMTTQSLQGWPSLVFMIYARDDGSDKDIFVAYGITPVPMSAGAHHLEVRTWFAVEANRERRKLHYAWFTGLYPRLEDEAFITDLQKRDDAGPLITTLGAGIVHLRLQLLFKDMKNLVHIGGESLYRALERLHTNTERARRRDDHHEAAMDELQAVLETEGVRSVREGRRARFEDIGSRGHSRDQSAAPSPMGSDAGYDRRRSFGGGSETRSRDPSPTRRAGSRDADSLRDSRRDGVRDSRRDGVRDSRRDDELRKSGTESVSGRDRVRDSQEAGSVRGSQERGRNRNRERDGDRRDSRQDNERRGEGAGGRQERVLARAASQRSERSSVADSREGSLSGSERSDAIMQRAAERVQRRGVSREDSRRDSSSDRPDRGANRERDLEERERAWANRRNNSSRA